MAKVLRESLSTRASSNSPRETYSATKGPHRKKVRPFIYRGSHIRKLLLLQSPGVWLCSSARTPLPYRLSLARPSPARSHSSPPTCATIAGLRACGISAGAWNTAVRTRGVFTHRDDFLKPACAERGLVRTGIALGRPGLVSTESQSFQNQRPLSSAPPTFSISAAHTIPSLLLLHRCIRALTGVRYNEAILTFRETTMSFGHLG